MSRSVGAIRKQTRVCVIKDDRHFENEMLLFYYLFYKFYCDIVTHIFDIQFNNRPFIKFSN